MLNKFFLFLIISLFIVSCSRVLRTDQAMSQVPAIGTQVIPNLSTNVPNVTNTQLTQYITTPGTHTNTCIDGWIKTIKIVTIWWRDCPKPGPGTGGQDQPGSDGWVWDGPDPISADDYPLNDPTPINVNDYPQEPLITSRPLTFMDGMVNTEIRVDPANPRIAVMALDPADPDYHFNMEAFLKGDLFRDNAGNYAIWSPNYLQVDGTGGGATPLPGSNGKWIGLSFRTEDLKKIDCPKI